MKLTITKIDQVLWSGEANSVTVPSMDGELTILPHHVPLISILKSGTIIVKPENGTDEKFLVESGFIEVGKEETVILV